jgi:transcription initiation factor TFIID subunit 5
VNAPVTCVNLLSSSPTRRMPSPTPMSVETPRASSQSPTAGSPVDNSQDATSNISQADKVVLDYLRSRGHLAAEKALLNALESGSPAEEEKEDTISAEELVKTLAVFASKPSRPNENVLKDASNVVQELQPMGNPPGVQNLIASIGAVGSEEILSLDPTDKQEGFRELEAWVDGSLDMYRVNTFLCFAE